MENKFYVYGHYTSGSDTPFYIGKGKDKRAYEVYGRSKEWNQVLDNRELVVKFIEGNLTEDVALEKEKYYIKLYGRKDIGAGILVNKTDGGDGISGQIYTEDRRKKISLSAKRSLVERIGEVKAKEVLEKTSRTRKELYRSGKLIPYWKGKKRSTETIEKLRRSQTGKSIKKTGRPILQLDTDLNIISEYNSVRDAATQLSIPIKTIYKSIYKQGKHHNGYNFRYK
jgi:hypothetical protein